MTCIAITGSSGYLGRAVARDLDARAEVEKVIGLDVREPAERLSKLEFVRHDVTADGLAEILARRGVDAAVHLAYAVRPLHDRGRMRRINILGARRFLDACSAAGVKTVLVASSATAYGAHPDNPEFLTEEAPLRPNESYPYAVDKREVETLAWDFAAKHPEAAVKVVRPCIIFGPNADNFLSRFINWDHAYLIRGAPARFQYVHEDDCARAIAELLFRGGAGAYNVAADGTTTMKEQARLAGKPILWVPGWLAYFAVAWRWLLRTGIEFPPGMLPYLRYPWLVDNSKLKKEIGFSYRYTTEETLRIMIEVELKRAARGAAA